MGLRELVVAQLAFAAILEQGEPVAILPEPPKILDPEVLKAQSWIAQFDQSGFENRAARRRKKRQKGR